MNPTFPINATNRLICENVPETDPLYIENQSIQAVLQSFNLGVDRSFVDGSVRGLTLHCTHAHLARMEGKYRDWKARGIRALQLVACEFLAFDLELDGCHARAFTFEKWLFVYDDGRKVPTAGSVDRYFLIKEEGEWKVDSVKFFAPEPEATTVS